MSEHTAPLSERQKFRYLRHLMLEDVAEEGQRRLLESRVLIVGLGGLGSPVAQYLAAAGVGRLGLADGDAVDESNLQRQVIHSSDDIGRSKVDSAARKITQLNPDVTVQPYPRRVDADGLRALVREYDFVIDATDNFPSKYAINAACVHAGIPFSHGGVLRFAGQTMTYRPGHACYACVFGEAPDEEAQRACSRAGILGAIPGMLGSIQAAEALKFLVGIGDLLLDRLLTFDAKRMTFRTIPISRNPACPVCGTL